MANRDDARTQRSGESTSIVGGIIINNASQPNQASQVALQGD